MRLPRWPHGGWLLGALALNGLVWGLDVLLFALRAGAGPALEVPELGFARGLVLIASYGALFAYFHHRYAASRPAPLEALWRMLLGGLGLLFLSWALEAAFGPPIASSPPVGFAALLRAHLLDLAQAVYAFWALFNLRELVLYKRTPKAVRRWNAMLLGFALSALSLFMVPYREAPHGLAIVLALLSGLLMLWCSFRLAWLVYLPARKKLAALVLAGLNAFLMGALLAQNTLGFWPTEAARQRAGWLYDYPLEMFGLLVLIFGVLYNSTTILSALFHLPTSAVFERKHVELSSLRNVSRLITELFDADKLVRTIAASAAEAVDARAAWLELLDLESGSTRPRLAASYGMQEAEIKRWADGELSRTVLERRQELLLSRLPDGKGSLLAVPLYAREEPMGVLYVAKDVAFGFEEDDVLLIRTLADQAALALENARLLEASLERERLRRELEIARAIQQRLLPQQIPEQPGLRIRARALMAERVGGDYYDFLWRADGQLAFAIADVSGKGISAAFYMAELKGIFQTLAREVPSPTDLLERANAALSAHLDARLFVSMLVGWLDPRTFRLRLARAGHPPALLRRAGGETSFLRTQGPGLGLIRDGRFRSLIQECMLTLEPGDLLLLYTDGLVEARSARGEEFGYERLLALLAEHNGPLEALEEELLKAVAWHTGQAAWQDDCTLVMLQRPRGEP
ncbi:MAG: SpoIIE family protein phosphatase [Bacteroidetes bacterium]|nr:SpoIIE family protein phosphatase [Rhodothermia bacterium]MCS7154644.1 SpoIIE family protein phosphatase [Bacteroidota bacterium]MCX7906361.1 SpoIIE family protein phosphatase [Bacteroidota bacterium]MDW8137437.1 SpoIIE family protein phosphatase [Bacteroidota bacterium]MDW8285609.1 SpoIIE family protein phosphatase [Bacteroidota bacterium]